MLNREFGLNFDKACTTTRNAGKTLFPYQYCESFIQAKVEEKGYFHLPTTARVWWKCEIKFFITGRPQRYSAQVLRISNRRQSVGSLNVFLKTCVLERRQTIRVVFVGGRWSSAGRIVGGLVQRGNI